METNHWRDTMKDRSEPSVLPFIAFAIAAAVIGQMFFGVLDIGGPDGLTLEDRPAPGIYEP